MSAHDQLRKLWFPDWTPEREDFPDGIRQLAAEGSLPLMRNPDEDCDWVRALIPGDYYPSLYKENPYSCMMPNALQALMADPFLPDEDQRLVREAYWRLRDQEDGKVSPSSANVPSPKPTFRQI